MRASSLTKLGAIIALACGASVADRASAASIIADNFDTYGNQAAFQAAWPAIGTVAPLSGELSTAQADSAPNSIRNPGTLTTGQSRNRRSFAETRTFSNSPLLPAENLAIGDKIVWSFEFYDSAPAGAPQRNHSNLQDTTAPTLTNQLVAMGFNNTQSGANSGGQRYMGRILGYNPPAVDPDGGPGEQGTLGSGAFFKLNDFVTSPVRSLGWHNLKVEITTNDGLSTDYAFFVDGILAELVSNVGTAASIRSYDNIVIGSGVSNGSTEVFYDDMRLQFIPIVPVPEPATLVVAGLGLVGCCFTARRKAA